MILIILFYPILITESLSPVSTNNNSTNMNAFPILNATALIQQAEHPEQLMYLCLKWGVLFYSITRKFSANAWIPLRRATIVKCDMPNKLLVEINTPRVSRSITIKFSSVEACDVWQTAMLQCTMWTVATYYKLDKFLGSGTFGTVYSAMRLKDDIPVAFKIVHNHRMRNFDELWLLSRMRHENLMYSLDILQNDKRTGIVLPLMDGDLSEFVEEVGPLPEALARNCMRHVLQGLSYLHAHRIAHRDLKLENILYSRGPNGVLIVKISDFGAAALLTEGQQFDGRKPPTTAISQAPEQVLKLKYGLEADVFSCGSILFEMLTGRMAFGYGAESKAEVFHRIARNILSPIPRDVVMSEAAIDLISKMHTPLPEQRISVNAALNHPWFS